MNLAVGGRVVFAVEPGQFFFQTTDALVLVAQSRDAAQKSRVVVGSDRTRRDTTATTTDDKPQHPAEDGNQHHDHKPRGLADASMTRRRLQRAVDDGIHPEGDSHQSRNEQHARHLSILGRFPRTGPGGTVPRAYDGGMRTRSLVVYSVLRILFFVVPFGLLMLLPIGRSYWWLSAIFAALIGLSLSVLLLRRPLDEISTALSQRRQAARERTDEEIEDASADEGPEQESAVGDRGQ